MNRQTLYSVLCDEALEAVRDLDRLYQDNRTVEQRERLAKIAEIQATLDKLKEVV